jgi:hypothetical protein
MVFLVFKLTKTPNLSGEEQQEYIELSIEQSKHVNIINDIMSISKNRSPRNGAVFIQH